MLLIVSHCLSLFPILPHNFSCFLKTPIYSECCHVCQVLQLLPKSGFHLANLCTILQIQIVPGEPNISKQRKTIATDCTHQLCLVNIKPPNFRVNLLGSANSWIESGCLWRVKPIHFPVTPETYYIGYWGLMDPPKKCVYRIFGMDIFTCCVNLFMANSDPRNRKF